MQKPQSCAASQSMYNGTFKVLRISILAPRAAFPTILAAAVAAILCAPAGRWLPPALALPGVCVLLGSRPFVKVPRSSARDGYVRSISMRFQISETSSPSASPVASVAGSRSVVRAPITDKKT